MSVAHVDSNGDPCNEGASYTRDEQAESLGALLAEVASW